MTQQVSVESFALKDYLTANGANGNFNVYRNTEEATGRTFFTLGFVQPGQTVKNSRGQDVQKHLGLGFSKNMEKQFGISKMTPEQVRDFALAHASEWRVTEGVKENGEKCAIPSMFLQAVSGSMF